MGVRAALVIAAIGLMGSDIGWCQALDAVPGEHFVVRGRRTERAPMPEDRADPAREAGRGHRDVMTGADISAFGDAYASGDPLGSDEKSNETGGGLVAPDHH